MPRKSAKPEVGMGRLLLLWVAMIGVFIALGFRLWNLQVAQGMEFQRRLVRQSLRTVRLPGILRRSRAGPRVALSENRSSFSVARHL